MGPTVPTGITFNTSGCYTQQVLQLAIPLFDSGNSVFLSELLIKVQPSTLRGKDWPIYVNLPITCLKITAIQYDTAPYRKRSLYLTATSVPLVRQRLLIMETRLWCELKQPCLFIWPPEKMEINVLWTLLPVSTCPPSLSLFLAPSSLLSAQGWSWIMNRFNSCTITEVPHIFSISGSQSLVCSEWSR